MTDTQALLADLRALAEKWKRPGLTCELDDDVYDDLTDLLAKHEHEVEPDVSERDELAQIIHAQDCNCSDIGHDEDYETADAILAAGWRKR